MNVNDLYAKLSYGELSNLAISNEGDGTILEAARPKVILHANEALLRLYGKFVLKEKELLLQLYDHITMYHLLPRFSTNYVPVDAPDDDEEIRYILDQPEELFEGDIHKVLAVYRSNGPKLPLNDNEQFTSVFTPQPLILQVPDPVSGLGLSVQYQAKHPTLTGGDSGAEEIELPEALHSALTSFIAYKVFSHMNTKDSAGKSQEYFATYTSICRDVQENDLVNTSLSNSSAKFHYRGWV